MNRNTYLKELERQLSRLPHAERENVLLYYTEHFQEAGEENEAQVIKDLGTPSQVASAVLSDYTIKRLDHAESSIKKGIPALWFAILAIFTLPITFPLAIALFAVVFSLVIVLGSIIFAIIATIIALFFAGLVSIVTGIILLFINVPTGLFVLGIGLMTSGIALLIFEPSLALAKSGVRGLIALVKKVFKRRKKNEEI